MHSNKKGQIRKFSLYNFFSKNNKGIVSEYLPWILIALAILAIVLISAFLMKGKGFQFIDQLKNLFRGG